MRTSKRHGIAIISVLLLAVLILGFIGAAMTSTPITLLSAKGFGDQQRADLACEAGLAYAQTRLRENPRWRGSIQTGPHHITSSTDTAMTVVEDHGNVVGLLVAEDGSRSQFRIRFNAQDGAGGSDGADDPNANFWLDSLVYLSYNNLALLASQPRQSTTGEPLPDVPPREVLLVIEGRAGPSLRDHLVSDVNAAPNGLRLVVQRLEVSLKPMYDDSLDAVLMAAGNVEVELPTATPVGDEYVEVASRDNLIQPRIRTKDSLNVSGGTPTNLISPGVIQTASGGVGPTTNLSSNATLGTEGTGEFLELDWADVKKADPSDPSTIRLKAGTYLVDDNHRLNYYDLEYADFEQAYSSGNLPAATVLSDDLNEVVENSGSLPVGTVRFWRPGVIQRRIEAVLEFNADVSVSSTGNAEGLSIVTSQGPISAQQDSNGNPYPGALDLSADMATPNLGLWLRGHDTEAVTLSARGDITLGGVLFGEQGGITTEGDLATRGTTFLDSSNSQTQAGAISTNLYAKGNIDISTYRTTGTPSNGTMGKYGHFLTSGVTYSWSDILINTQEDGVPVGGHFRQVGAMVAYGGNPSNQAPGEQSGLGNVFIKARNALFIYDSSYLGIIEPTVPPESFRIMSIAKR